MDRAIEAASELTETISKFKYTSSLKDIPDEQVAGLHKLANIFQVSTNKINKKGGTKEKPAPMQQTITAPPLPNRYIPAPRVNPR